MSEEKTIKLKYKDKEEVFKAPQSYKDFISELKKLFSLEDEKMNQLSLFYKDTDYNIEVPLNESYYTQFYQSSNETEKIIEISVKEKNEPNIIEQKSAISIKNDNIDNTDLSLHNSSLIENINESKKKIDNFSKGIGEVNNLINKTLEENKDINIKKEESNKIEGKNEQKKNLDNEANVLNKEKEKENGEENISIIKPNNEVLESIINNKEESIINNNDKKEVEDDKEKDNNNNGSDKYNLNDKNKDENKSDNLYLKKEKEVQKIKEKGLEEKEKIIYKKEKINNNNNCFRNTFLFLSLLIIILSIIIYFKYDEFNKLLLNFLIRNKKMTIIGIDFGSTFSGYSIIYDSEINFEDRDSNQIISSELILDNDTKIGLRIGNRAHNFPKNRIVRENKLYFQKFKKNLDPKNNNNYALSSVPKDINVDLEDVIKGFLVLLREEIQNNNIRIRDKHISQIKWVLTVPPLWDDKGKKFMQKVAYKSGMIHSEIALEPEAASLAIFHDKSIKKKFLVKGTNFLIVDAGGYTLDISANKIIDNYNNLEQLLKPTSYKLGSNLINEKIIEIIEAVYGKKKIEEVIKKDYEAWEKTLDEIEEKKKEINDNIADNFRLNIKFYQSKCGYMSDICEGTYNGIKISYSSKYIDIPSKIIKDIISVIAFKIVNEINRSFSKTNENINLIVLTGGFSNCKIFQKKIRDNFRGSLKELVFLADPQKTVMKGAAIFGLRPNQILYRISPVTIGIENYEYIKENEKCKKVVKDNEDSRCLNYLIFTERGKPIKTDQIIEYNIKPISDNIIIYYSFDDELNENNINTWDIEDESTFEIPFNENLPMKNRTITLSMKFSNYINVTLMDHDLNKGIWKILYYPV